MNKFLRLTAIVTVVLLTGINYSYSKTSDCFERVNRAVFSFNMALDKAIFKPVSKGYSYLPSPVKASVGNATSYFESPTIGHDRQYDKCLRI